MIHQTLNSCVHLCLTLPFISAKLSIICLLVQAIVSHLTYAVHNIYIYTAQVKCDTIACTRRKTLREEHRLRVFENRVLRGIFGPKRDEVTGEWRRLRNEKLNDQYSSPNIIRVIKSRTMRWAGHVARMGEVRSAYRILVGRPEGRRPLGRPRRRWEDNVKMDFHEVG
jgi:hypothetical protein